VISGESKEEEVMGEGTGEPEMENWYQNEVDEEIKGVDWDKVKHNERSDHVFISKYVDGRATVTTVEERVLTLNRDEVNGYEGVVVRAL